MCHLLLATAQARDFSSRDIWKIGRVLFIFGYGAPGAEAIASKIPWGMRSWELLCDSLHCLALAGILLRVDMGERVPGLSENTWWLGSDSRPQTRMTSLPGHASVLRNH